MVLSEHLPLLASAPDGIQKLRGLILELAVRGKLVPQDPKDEPASELLKRIAKERARLEADGTCKKSKATPLSDDDPRPFDIPAGWSWVRIAEIGHDWGQKTPDADFTYVDVSAIDNERGTVDSPTVVAPADAPSRARKVVRRGTVIYSTVRPYLLNIAVIDHDLTPAPIASTAFAVIHPFAGLSSQYIFWYLRSPVFVRYVESVQTGIAYPAVNDSQFFSGLFPLPPLAEQHRIVAKVDELMALCDRLEAEVGAGETAHAKLVETLLGTLTQSTDAADLAANWQRLAEHFDTLFTTESSLNALKQTILQLAVMGKLVPQNPNDEPASELLKRIAKERARLVNLGKIRAPKSLGCISESEAAYVAPAGWEWAKFGLIVELINGDRSKNYPNREEYVPRGVPWINTGHIQPDGTLATDGMHFITREKFDSLRGGKIESGDLVYCLRGATFGKTAFVTPYSEGAIASSLVILRPYLSTLSRFLFIYLTCPFGRSQIFRFDNGSAQPNLSANSVTLFAFAMPPLAEQHRIVAKVDELMALCDELKAKVGAGRTAQERLASTLIETALAA